jgi:leucyl aminopeptidase (aminopeptidase T)
MKSAEIILRKCMHAGKNEVVLIVTDHNKLELAKPFLSCAAGIAKMAVMITMKPRRIDGEEPPRNIAVAMKNADVVLILTTRSLSHTKARKEACKAGARIASMPGITADILKSAIDVDYRKLAKVNAKFSLLITKAKTVRITTAKGTDLSFSVRGRKCEPDSGIYSKKGSWGNLPAGEVYIAPVEGSANGVYVVDASMSGIGRLAAPLKFTVKNGLAVKIEGRNARDLKKQIAGLGKSALNIAEFGIGTNPKAIVSGIVLEDEKALHTCHIAIGSNTSFGGKTKAKCHLDGVIRNPTVWLDSRKVIELGKLVV